ncbi:MAG TPA: RidA family protein [Streptosporangiaceae bacterium]|nr:RidA family protein [Streptosporangiaceae bacterium]
MPVTDRLTDVQGVSPGPGFAHAVTVAGQMAFVSGQVGLDATGQIVAPGDLRAQTRQALSNLEAILRALGADWADVARLSWYVLDASDVQVIRDVRDEMIRPTLGGRANPASTLVQVAALVRPEFLVEVDAVVALPGSQAPGLN